MPDTIDPYLERMGKYLRDAEGLSFEWSLRVSEEGVSDRDRVSCWVQPDTDRSASFAAVRRLLIDLAAPREVVRSQSLRAPHSVMQGVGLARAGDTVEWRLYLHSHDRKTRRVHYDAFRWLAGGETVDSASYHFHFLPETPEGETPLDFVHPRFSSVMGRLLRHERLRQISGFWIRCHRDEWDQIDLTYAWHPPLAEVGEAMHELTSQLHVSSDWIDRYTGYPLRHIAFTAGERQNPHCTVYFSGAAGDSWPRSIAELKEQVREAGNAMHDALESQFFSEIPPASIEPIESRPDYDSGSTDAWRQELLPFLPPRGTIYVIGCGWGGPAGVLEERGYSVTGITPSRAQFRYCASLGQTVRYGDLETTLPPGRFDCALLLESFEFVREKRRLLRVLRLFAGRLVMRVHSQDPSELRTSIKEAGWNVIHWREEAPAEWAECNPLIEVVAD